MPLQPNSYTWFLSSNPHNNTEVGTIIIPILQMKKLEVT